MSVTTACVNLTVAPEEWSAIQILLEIHPNLGRDTLLDQHSASEWRKCCEFSDMHAANTHCRQQIQVFCGRTTNIDGHACFKNMCDSFLFSTNTFTCVLVNNICLCALQASFGGVVFATHMLSY